MVRYKLKPSIGTKGHEPNGVPHDIKLLEIQLPINSLFQV